MENITYKECLFTLLLGKNQNTKDSIQEFIKNRKTQYGIRGCCLVDPQRLILTPLKHLGAAYESMGELNNALKYALEPAINIIKDHSNQIDRTEVSDIFKHFLQRAKSIALTILM